MANAWHAAASEMTGSKSERVASPGEILENSGENPPEQSMKSGVS
eukprot:CAMPEP_0179874304 /NCGR_PEP_ID=MMETSP0982-20121206/22778_1 /TAXON_ID=483367 /ORGANISM="non described non described, Strain CCMP 2436" /LENGTH=44 /DNA_ID= /DNA_START= /DNA_END= /DNA_ORIENTATION=